jgi:hypothetical protein
LCQPRSEIREATSGDDEGGVDRRIIYLDLNHWYMLAEAKQKSDSSQPGAVKALERLRELRAAQRIVLPLSSVHYMEVTENPRDHLRHAVAEVMEELSDFWTIAPTALIVTEEFDASLQAEFGLPEEVRVTPKIGRGFGFAFGTAGQLRITGPPESIARLRDEVGEETLSAWEEWANTLKEQVLLRGDRTLFGLSVPGFEPYAGRKVADEELARIRRVVENLRNDASLRRRLPDVVLASELAVEIFEQFKAGMSRAGIDVVEFVQSANAKERMTRLMMGMPSRRVSVAVKEGYYRDPNHRWTVNDIRDIAALSLATPYCDVVVTDRQVAHALRAAGVEVAFSTVVLNTLSGLTDYLDALEGFCGEAADDSH